MNQSNRHGAASSVTRKSAQNRRTSQRRDGPRSDVGAQPPNNRGQVVGHRVRPESRRTVDVKRLETDEGEQQDSDKLQRRMEHYGSLRSKCADAFPSSSACSVVMRNGPSAARKFALHWPLLPEFSIDLV